MSKGTSVFKSGSGFGAKKTTTEHSDPYLERLQKIIDAYDEKKPDYRFYTVVYSSAPAPKAKASVFGAKTGFGAKPGGTTSAFGNKTQPFISTQEWESYKKLAGEGFQPEVLKKNDLAKRKTSQTNTIALMKKKIEKMKDDLKEIEDSYRKTKEGGISNLIKNNQEIIELLMKVVFKKEINALKDQQFCKEEQELLDKLEIINANINKPNQYESQMNKIKLLSRFLADSKKSTAQTLKLSDDTKKDICAVLESNNKSIQAMTEVIKTIQNFCSVQEKLLSQQQ